MGIKTPPPLRRRPDPHCRRCPAWRNVETICVSGRGSNGVHGPYPEDLDILFVAEQPGTWEDKEGVCLVGRSGGLFDAFVEWHLKRDYTWEATNVVRCYLGSKPNKEPIKPMLGTPKKPGSMRQCQPYLYREIRELEPKVIVAMGVYATAAVLQCPPNAVTMKKCRLTPWKTDFKGKDGEPIEVFPIEHPSAALRLGIDKYGNGPGKDFWEIQWNKLMAYLKGEDITLPGAWEWAGDWDQEQTESFYETLMEYDKVAFDYETEGLNPRIDKPRMVGYSWGPDEAVVVPLRKSWQMALHERFLQRYEGNVAIHSFSMELVWAQEVFGTMPQGLVLDTKVLDFLVDENRSKKLEDLVNLHTPDLAGFKRMTERVGLFEAPDRILAERCAFDCMATFRIEDILWDRLTPRQQTLYTEIERSLRATAMCSVRGWKADVAKLQEILVLAEATQEELGEKIRELPEAQEVENLLNPPSPTGRKRKRKYFNPNSNQHVPDLFKRLGVDDGRHRQPNDPDRMRVAKEILWEYKHKHPAVQWVIDYRAMQKARSTFVQPLIDSAEADDGYLHPKYNWGGAAREGEAEGTVSGRLSCSKPNLLNLPSPRNPEIPPLMHQIREAIVSRFEGGRVLSADYSQAELMLMAMFSKEPSLLEAYEKKIDVHQHVAAQIGKDRYSTKAINYSAGYLAAAQRLSLQLRCSLEEAEAMLDAWWGSKPVLQAYVARQKRLAYENCYVEGVFGMRLHCPDIRASEYQKREHAARRVWNYPIQNACSMLCFLAMGRVEEELEDKESCLFGNLYDGLYIDCHPDEDAEEIKAMLQEVMVEEPYRQYDWLTMRIPVDFKLGRTMAG